MLSPPHILRPWQRRLTALAAAQVGLRATSPVAAAAARGPFERSSPDRAVSRACTPLGASRAPPALKGACSHLWPLHMPCAPPREVPGRSSSCCCWPVWVGGSGLWLGVVCSRAVRRVLLPPRDERLVLSPQQLLRPRHRRLATLVATKVDLRTIWPVAYRRPWRCLRALIGRARFDRS